MQSQIRTQGVRLTEGLRLHVNRRLNFALDRFTDHIGSITVRVRDLNGTRGRHEKLCSIELNLISLGRTIIEDRAATLFVAVDRATDRLGTSIARSLKRTSRRKAGSIRHMNPKLKSEAAQKGISPCP